MAAIDPQRAYQEAEAAGKLSVSLPQHLQDALEGIVPPAKAAPAPTPNVTAQKLPNQSPTKNPLAPVCPPSPSCANLGPNMTSIPWRIAML